MAENTNTNTKNTLSSSAPKHITTQKLMTYSLANPNLSCTDIGLKYGISRQAVSERFRKISFDPHALKQWKAERADLKAFLQSKIEDKQIDFVTADDLKIENWRELLDAEKVKSFSGNAERLDRMGIQAPSVDAYSQLKVLINIQVDSKARIAEVKDTHIVDIEQSSNDAIVKV